MAAGTNPPQQVGPATGYYEALRSTPDRTNLSVRPYSQDWTAVIRSLRRDDLIALARYLYDNDGTVSYAVDTIANYSTPLTPQPTTVSPEWNAAALTYWTSWCKRADFTGRFDFGTIQRLVCKALDVDGDVGATMTNENGFAQVQLIDSWRIRSARITAPYSAGVFVGDGVLCDKKGRILSYYLDSSPEPIPANQLLLMFDPDRYESYRGVTPIRRGANDVRDMKDIKGFEKLATKINCALAGVIEQDGPLEEDVWGDDTGTDGSAVEQDDATATEFEKKFSVADLLGGDFLPMSPGSKLHQITNARPGDKVTEFLDFLAASFVLGLGIPPAFFLDQKLNGPNNRSVNGKAQRKFDQRQEIQGRFLEWTWMYVISDAIVRGELEPIEGFTEVEWMGPPKLSIDAGRDASAWRDDHAVNLMTRRDHFGARGMSWRTEKVQSLEEDEEIIEDCKAMSQRTGVPLETLLARWGFQANQAKPVEETPPKEEPAEANPKAKKETP